MYYLIILAVIILDQATKSLIRANLDLNQSITVIGGVLNLTYIKNFGAAFSILQNRQVFLVAFTAAVSSIIFILLVRNIRKAHWTMLLSLSLIIGGGVGNMIDRIRTGFVVDFLEIRLFSFPVFNVADMAVVGGSILLIVYILFFDHSLKLKGKDADAN